MSLTLLTGILAAALSQTSSAPSADRGDLGDRGTALECHVALLESLDRRTVSLSATEEQLDRVLQRLNDELDVTVRADWGALGIGGVYADTPVTLAIDGLRASDALETICLTLADDLERPVFEAAGGQIVLTTVRGTTSMRFAAVYDIRDLVARAEELGPAFDTPILTPAPDDAADPDDDDAVKPLAPAPAQTADQRLMSLILEHVDPEAWFDYGGSRGRITQHEGTLVVSATASVHRRLDELFRQLRQALPTGLEIDAAIVRVPREAIAALRPGQDVRSAEYASAVRGLARAETLWRSSLGAALGQEVVANVRAPERSVRVALMPRLEESSGLLRVSAGVAMELEGAVTEVTTSVAAAIMDGGAVIELAEPMGAEHGEVIVLTLVFRPT